MAMPASLQDSSPHLHGQFRGLSTITPPIPADENERLATLRSYAILDTAPEGALDRLTRYASKQFDVPVALVSLVDEHRQWNTAPALKIKILPCSISTSTSSSLSMTRWVTRSETSSCAARQISSGARAGEDRFVARLGGDEFVILKRVDKASCAKVIGLSIMEEFAQPQVIHGNPVASGASVAIAISPHDGTDPEELLRRADIAMCKGKGIAIALGPVDIHRELIIAAQT